MKNRYEIRGNVTIIFLNEIDGRMMTTMIDTEDLKLLAELNVTWFAHKQNSSNFYYVRATLKNNGSAKTYLLHRYLTDAPSDMVVDHFDGDTLNNRRKSNLKVVTHSKNLQNAKTYKNNTTGERGVLWVKRDQRWKAILKLNGRYVLQKNCSSYDEAVSVVRVARKRYFENYNESRTYER